MTDAERAEHHALCAAAGGCPTTQSNANDADKPVAEAVLAYLSDLFGVAEITRHVWNRRKPRDISVNTTASRTLYSTIIRLYTMGAREVPLTQGLFSWLAGHFAIKVTTKVRTNLQAFRAFIFSVLLQRARAHDAFSRK